jgi:hypothetical protein
MRSFQFIFVSGKMTVAMGRLQEFVCVCSLLVGVSAGELSDRSVIGK